MTAGWDETEVLMDVSSRRLAPVQHRHLPARGLLSLFSLLRAFLLTVIKRNQAKNITDLVPWSSLKKRAYRPRVNVVIGHFAHAGLVFMPTSRGSVALRVLSARARATAEKIISLETL